MIISYATDLCCFKNCHTNKKTGNDVTLMLDCVAGAILLVIGILFALGMLPLNPAAGWAILGAGVVYTTTMLLALCTRVRITC